MHAATNAQQGDLPIVSAARQEQLKGIAHGIDGSERCYGLFVHPQGIDVGSARKQNAVGAAQEFVDGREVGCGRDDEGQTTRAEHGFIVTGAERTARFAEIATDHNERSALGDALRGALVDFVQVIIHVL